MDSTAPGPPAGLCDACAHRRAVQTDRSTFTLCERALTDPRYRKYPILPVWSCPGFERVGLGAPADDKLTG